MFLLEMLSIKKKVREGDGSRAKNLNLKVISQFLLFITFLSHQTAAVETMELRFLYSIIWIRAVLITGGGWGNR